MFFFVFFKKVFLYFINLDIDVGKTKMSVRIRCTVCKDKAPLKANFCLKQIKFALKEPQSDSMAEKESAVKLTIWRKGKIRH